MSKKKKKSSAPANVVKRIQHGAVFANICRGCSPHDGHTYLYYTLHREFLQINGDKNSNDRFYPRNEEDLVRVAGMASRWIAENPEAADGTIPAQASAPLNGHSSAPTA